MRQPYYILVCSSIPLMLIGIWEGYSLVTQKTRILKVYYNKINEPIAKEIKRAIDMRDWPAAEGMTKTPVPPHPQPAPNPLPPYFFPTLPPLGFLTPVSSLFRTSRFTRAMKSLRTRTICFKPPNSRSSFAAMAVPAGPVPGRSTSGRDCRMEITLI